MTHDLSVRHHLTYKQNYYNPEFKENYILVEQTILGLKHQVH